MAAPSSVTNVLFLCTGNSARSILAEAITNKLGRGRFRAFSAGSRPAGKVNPYALELLIDLGYETAELRSKSWNEFSGAAAPEMDIVITLCDEAAGESCPVWPGHPLIAHWSIPDPAAHASRHAMRSAFAEAYRVIEQRVSAMTDLPFSVLDEGELRRQLQGIAERGSCPVPAWSL
jgi:arsenate reductase